MKKSFIFTLLFLCGSIVYAQSNTEVIRLSEPVLETDIYEVFGSELDVESLQPTTLTDIIEGERSTSFVTLKTSIAEVCSKKGCFFIAQDGDYTARITFKDYSFFIPTDSQGKEVMLVGEFSTSTLSEEQAKHYAEDAGQDADQIQGEQKEYSVVATSIVVPKSK